LKIEKITKQNEIENTRHSSGLGVNAMVISNMEPDE
jgi:hypothetical protein